MRFFFLASLLCIVTVLSAQEREGIVFSNYHPTSSVHFNAANSVDSRAYMQFNFVGINVGGYTNLVSIPQFNVPKFVMAPNLPSISPITNDKKKYLYLGAVIDGPSFYMSKNNFGLGVYIRGRSVVDVRRMPYQIADFLLNTGNSDPSGTSGSLDIRNAKFSNMTWLEYGINGGYMLKQRAYDLISVGVNLKYLTGLNLQYVNLHGLQAEYNPALISVSTLIGSYKSAAFAYGAGKGFSGDVGFIYKKMMKQVDAYKSHSKKSSSHCQIVDYKYKLGVSLRDLGYIKYRRGTSVMALQGNGLIATDSQLSPEEQFKANFNLTQSEGDAIRAILPGALTVQGDYNFGNSIYVSAAIQKGIIPNGVTGVQAPDFISVAPRFETRNIEVALPIVLQKFVQLEIGFALRIRSLVVGVDNVVPVIMTQNTKSVGVYVSLGWTLFRNRKCGAGAGKIDDCSHYKNGSGKIKLKSTLISARPIKEKKHHRPQKRSRKLWFWLT